MPCSPSRSDLSRRSFAQLLGFGLMSCKRVSRRASMHARLRGDLRRVIDTHAFSGVLLLTQGPSTILSATRGFANATNTPIVPENCFVIGSISKQITAVLVMRAYQNQYLDLQDPVGNYLSDIAPLWAKQVTLHHLLTHTHGIQDLKEPLKFEVGTRFEYSQLGYHLLARVLEAIRKTSFRNICAELFSNLKLHGIFHPEDRKKAQLVEGFERSDPGNYSPAKDSLKNYAAAGSLISTATDLARWNELLHSGAIVAPSTLARVTKRYATRAHPIFGDVEYGYGLLFQQGEANLQIGALGYAPGFASASYYYPQHNMNLVVLSNRVDLAQGFTKAFAVHLRAMNLVKAYQRPPLTP